MQEQEGFCLRVTTSQPLCNKRAYIIFEQDRRFCLLFSVSLVMSQQEERRHTEDEHQSTPLFDERWPPYEESVRESMSISSSASEFGPPPEEPPPPKPIQVDRSLFYLGLTAKT